MIWLGALSNITPKKFIPPCATSENKPDKLLFPLCSQCILDRLQECLHNESERMLTGTWITSEINKALKEV